MVSIITHIRRHGPPEGLDLPIGGMDEVDQFEQSMPLGGGPPHQQQQPRQTSRPPSVANSFSTPPQHNGERPSFFKTPPKPPSVVGSVDGYR